MTNVIIYGLLGELFGKNFKFKVNNSLNAIKALDANKRGFLKKLIDLSKIGYDYAIVVDGEVISNENELIQNRKIKSISLVPIIIGFGFLTPILTQITMKMVLQAVVMAVVSAAISYATSMIMMSLNKQPIPQQNIAVGGTTTQVEAAARSFVFSNDQNTNSQGESLPLGYGLLKVDSKVINSSISSYSTNLSFSTDKKVAYSIFSDFNSN